MEDSLGTAMRTLLILNPGSGHSDGRDEALRGWLDPGGDVLDVHKLGPNEPDDLAQVVRRAIDAGADRVVAAGGDGTVAAVAAALIGTNVPLGIVPLGTANVMARELGVPLDPAAACRLIAGTHELDSIDAMEVDGRCYFTQVGVGVDSLMIRDTDTRSKKRFGRLAYIWSGLRRLLGFSPRRFVIQVDGGSQHVVRASQVLVANVGAMGAPALRWGPGIRPDDGKLTLCIVRARTLWHYARIAWHVLRGTHNDDPLVHYLAIRHTAEIGLKTSSRPLPVQADGEIIGQTPVRLKLLPAAVRLIVPAESSETAQED